MWSTVAPPVAAAPEIDESGEAPLLLQNAVQEPRILRRRQAVDRVVGRHDRSGMRLAHRRLERRQVALGEPPLVDLGRITIAAAFADVGEEMLRRRDDPVALEGLDEGTSHHGRQKGILPVGLLHAPPPDVVGNVDHR
jgi:hypothetical protein